jgi:hypothetical protein
MGKKKAAPRPPPPPPPQSSPSSVSLPPILLHAFVLLLGYLVARLSLRHLSPPASLPPPPEVPCSPTSTTWQSSFLFPPSDLSSLASRGLHYLCVSPLNSSHSLLTVYPHASLAGSGTRPAGGAGGGGGGGGPPRGCLLLAHVGDGGCQR